MAKIIRGGNIEIEMLDKNDYSDAPRGTWIGAKEDLGNKNLRLPTEKELGYIHNLLYLNHGGNFIEGSEYWTSEKFGPETEGSDMGSHLTVQMNYRGEYSVKYNYHRMPYIGVRDI